MAFRFREILTKRPNALPKLHSFECAKIRDVRNHLLEHPQSQSLSQDHSLGGANGPQLKLDTGVSEQTDCGLFVNATEFKERLHTFLNLAIVELNSQ